MWVIRILTFAAAVLNTAADVEPGGNKPALVDLHGDPLPPGAIARLGTSRLQHQGPVHALAYSPDGKWLASAGEDKIIRLWDAQTAKEKLSLEGHQQAIHALVFLPGEEGKPINCLVSGSHDRTIRFWDLQTGKETAPPINHPGAVNALAVSHDGKLLASGGRREAVVILWNTKNGKEVRRWQAHLGGINSLVFAPNDKVLASGGFPHQQTAPQKSTDPVDDFTMALWEINTGKRCHAFSDHTTITRAIVFSADGKFLASAGMGSKTGRSIILWDALTFQKIRAVGNRFSIIDAHCLAFAKDGKTLAAGDFGHVKLFDCGTGAEQRPMPTAIMDHIFALKFSSDDLTLASAGKKGRIILWDVVRRTAKQDEGPMQPLTGVAVSPSGKIIATTDEEGWAWLWDRTTSKPLHRLKQAKNPGVALVWSAAFSPDSRTLALSHQSDGITFWDVTSGQLKRHIPEPKLNRITCLAYSSDGKWLASESLDQSYTSLWDATSGQLMRTYRRGGDGGNCVAISPDGRLLAATARNGLNMWELDSGQPLFVKSDYAVSLAFSPGAFLVATVGYGGKIFDATTGEKLGTFPCQKPPYGGRSISFSPDGRLIAFADGDRIKFWDVLASKDLKSLEGHRGNVTSVTFMPDGSAIVSSAGDGTALIWNVANLLQPLGAKAVLEPWRDLNNTDCLRAYAAFCQLRASPTETLNLLKTKLKPAAAVSAQDMAKLIKQLGDDSLQVRESATKELKKHGQAAEKALVEAARNHPSPQFAKQIDRLLGELKTDKDGQRQLISLKLLEELPTVDSLELLQVLAKEDTDSPLALAARTILERMKAIGRFEKVEK